MNLDKKIIMGRGIFVFSDPAGSNTVFAIIDYLISLNKTYHKDFLVFTNEFGSFEEKYSKIVKRIVFSNELCSKIEKEFRPDFIFSATSLNNFEHLWRIYFFKKIKIYSFVDHWCNYYKRFFFNDQLCFGDEVWVIDKIAAQAAIQDKIPKNLIRTKGNPYYEKVKNFKPIVLKKSFFLQYNLDEDKIIILFISDDIKDNFDVDQNGNCILGFDEYSVLTDVLETLNNLSLNNKLNLSDYQFVVKIHPKANFKKFDRLIKKFDLLEIKIIKNCDSLTINYYSNYIFGMFSNMVIESFLMKKNLLRVQTGQLVSDLINIKGIKDQVVKDINKLYSEMNIFLNN